MKTENKIVELTLKKDRTYDKHPTQNCKDIPTINRKYLIQHLTFNTQHNK